MEELEIDLDSIIADLNSSAALSKEEEECKKDAV